MAKPTVQTLFEHAVHYGHPKDKRNPKMNEFIYGLKDGIHIINLEKTLEYLDSACDFLKKSSLEGKRFLFVGTKPQASTVLRQQLKGLPVLSVTKKWPAGLLTNFDTLKMRIKYLKDLNEKERSGEFDKYTKKEQSNMKKMMEKLDIALGGVLDMDQTPDIMVVIDAYKEQGAIREAKKLGIPVVAIVDTNGDPTTVDYPVPANDDTFKSLNYIMSIMVEAATAGMKK